MGLEQSRSGPIYVYWYIITVNYETCRNYTFLAYLGMREANPSKENFQQKIILVPEKCSFGEFRNFRICSIVEGNL